LARAADGWWRSTAHDVAQEEIPPMFATRRSLVAFLALSALLPGCFDGSGHLETRSFALDGFEAIEAGRYVTVEVVRGDAFAVAVTADDNLWSELTVRREGETLSFSLSDTHAVYSGVTVLARVTLPTLSRLHVSGGAHASLSGFDALVPSLVVHGSGGSTVEGTSYAEELSIELSGGSKALLSGSAGTLIVDASGGSIVDFGDANADHASVWMSGASHGAVTATGKLDYHLSGGSHLDYAGEPELGQAELSGGSTASEL
jgi:hypothetical protein